jgi:hypothetical protein
MGKQKDGGKSYCLKETNIEKKTYKKALAMAPVFLLVDIAVFLVFIRYYATDFDRFIHELTRKFLSPPWADRLSVYVVLMSLLFWFIPAVFHWTRLIETNPNRKKKANDSPIVTNRDLVLVLLICLTLSIVYAPVHMLIQFILSRFAPHQQDIILQSFSALVPFKLGVDGYKYWQKRNKKEVGGSSF